MGLLVEGGDVEMTDQYIQFIMLKSQEVVRIHSATEDHIPKD